jgi:hypothetical protein
MKRISLFLPLVILLASCAQVPAVPTVTATFTATPTQLPTATATPVPPTETVIPTEVIPASPFIELTNKETGEMAIPREAVVYTSCDVGASQSAGKKTRIRGDTATVANGGYGYSV